MHAGVTWALRMRRAYARALTVFIVFTVNVFSVRDLVKPSFSHSTSVFSALEALAKMRYINLRFTLHYMLEVTMQQVL